MKYEIKIVNGFEDDFMRFVKSLDKATQAKVLRVVDLLEKYGNELGMPFIKKINKVIWELRISGKQRIRILYCMVNDSIWLLNWFIKKRQKTPIGEVETAMKRIDRI